ncbi:PH domain-like protein, partial [Nadsonia fulvescens var. elongata DSM 6958]
MSSLPTSYEPDRLIKCGWQQIRTKHKSWRRQWIVLRGHTITYYKDEREYKPQEIISLSYASASIIAVTDLNQNNDNYSGKVRWAIFTPSQNRYFRANDLITAKEWVAAVKSVCNSFANNHPSKGTQPSLSQAGWH